MTEFVVDLDLDGVTGKAALMDRCVRALALPAWFGRNWDALIDSLSDASLWPAEAAGRRLLVVVRNWRPYAQARPEEWRTAEEVFADAVAREPRLSVALAPADGREDGRTHRVQPPLEFPPSAPAAPLEDPPG